MENVALQSDLEAIDGRDGRRTRLTTGLRAADPDVSSDHRQIVFTVQREDRRDVVVAPFTMTPGPAVGTPRVLASGAGVEYASPRWSPDGTMLAVERHQRGSLSQIVLIDARTGTARVAAAFDKGRCVSPAWTPDGRRLIFAATREDRPFQLFAWDVAAGTTTRLEGTGPSATSPDVSKDGKTIVFVGYTPAGYDLFTMPLASAVWTPVSTGTVSPAAGPTSEEAEGPVVRSYAPIRSLAPRYWTPVILSDAGETEFGAETSGSDALGRHGYSANVRWATSRGRPDWQASYTYDRWWPLLFANVSDDTDPYGPGEARSREVNAGAVFPWAHIRWSQSVLGAANIAADTIVCAACPRPIDLRADRRSLRAGYSFSSARSYGYSISREEGWSATATEDSIGEWLGSDGNAGSVIADVRGYHRLFSQHQVIAARAAIASSWGDQAVRRAFTAGGSGPRPGGFVFDTDAIGLVRGFDDGIPGWHAAVANLDVRFPLVRVQRGFGTLPAFVRVIHGAVFVDAGHAWDDAFHGKDVRVSAGVELSADTVLGYSLPLTITGGLAIRHDGLDRTSSVTVFGRIGRAF
jgi:hypothetical protein